MLTLYDFKSSGNGYKVRLLLHQLRLPFIYVETNILKGESRTPQFLEMNPNGKVPTLALGDRLLSGGIQCDFVVSRGGDRISTKRSLATQQSARVVILRAI